LEGGWSGGVKTGFQEVWCEISVGSRVLKGKKDQRERMAPKRKKRGKGGLSRAEGLELSGSRDPGKKVEEKGTLETVCRKNKGEYYRRKWGRKGFCQRRSVATKNRALQRIPLKERESWWG